MQVRALRNPLRLAALQRRRSLRVHLGCGDDRLPGYVNIDYRPTSAVDVAMDLSLPRFAEGSVVFAFSNAFFEHLYRPARGPHLEGQAAWWLGQLHKSLFDEDEIAALLAPSGFGSYVMFCYGYPGDFNEMPVTMGFYATCGTVAPADLREECLSFLGQFADTRIRLATLEWLPRSTSYGS
jgi:hypothetical protein